jgi:hypothetical protein
VSYYVFRNQRWLTYTNVSSRTAKRFTSRFLAQTENKKRLMTDRRASEVKKSVNESLIADCFALIQLWFHLMIARRARPRTDPAQPALY